MLFQPGFIERLRAISPLMIRVLVGILTVFAISPFLLTLRPPLQDFPQHLAAGHVLLEPNDPQLRFEDYFSSEWLRSQYLGIYVLLGLFYYPLKWFVEQPLLVASRLSIAVLALAWAASSECLGSRLLRRHGFGLFFLVLFFNAHLILGFLNFLLGTAFCFLTLWLLAEVRARRAANPAHRTPAGLRLLLSGSALATFYFHVVPFAIVLAVFAASLAVDALLLRFVPKRQAPTYSLSFIDNLSFLPAVIALCAWLVSPAGQSTRQAAQGGDEHVKAVFTSASANTAALDSWLTDVFRSAWDTRLMYLAVSALLAYTVLEWAVWALTRKSQIKLSATESQPHAQTPNQDSVLIWLLRLGAPACAVAYYVTPASYDWIWPINARFPLLALLLLPFWLPAAPTQLAAVRWLVIARSVMTATCIVIFAVASAGETVLAREAFRGFAKEIAGLDDVLEAIPYGKKVATLVFDRGSRFVSFSPFLHVGAYYQAERGGVSYFSFNDFPQSPVRFLPADRPPKAKPRWEWRPESVRPDDELGWFDYVIVRGGPATLKANHGFSQQMNAGRFRLYKNNQSDDVSP